MRSQEKSQKKPGERQKKRGAVVKDGDKNEEPRKELKETELTKQKS